MRSEGGRPAAGAMPVVGKDEEPPVPSRPGARGAKGASRGRGRDDQAVLAEAVNLRSASLREALEQARTRRLELAAARAELLQAREEMARLRSRRTVRLALVVSRLWRRFVSRRGAANASAGGRGAPTPPTPTPSFAREPGPAAYRANLLERIGASDRSRGSVAALRVGAAEGAGIRPEPYRAMGWELRAVELPPAPVVPRAPGVPPTPVVPGDLDVVLVGRPLDDPRWLPRGVVRVACIAGDPVPWTETAWFDAYDVVLVPSAEAADVVRSHSSKTATVVCPGADEPAEAWPPADGVRDALVRWLSSTRVALMVQALRWDLAEPSGDYHLARALQRELERRGHPTSVYFQREWKDPATAREDAMVHLWGRYELDARPTQVNVLWILYHPELVTDDLLRRYDLVFAASDRLARELSDRSGVPVRPLHQATDAERFRPVEGGPHHELLFVANSRGMRRTIIDDLTPTSHDLAVYGGGWDPERLDPRYLRASVVPNHRLPAMYAAADIVLNDHWVEAAEAGIINNRIYDALAAGAFVISDRVDGLDEEVDGGVVTYADPAELALLVERYLADPDARRARAERGRRAVLARHTIGHRAATLLDVILPLVEERGRRDGHEAGAPS